MSRRSHRAYKHWSDYGRVQIIEHGREVGNILSSPNADNHSRLSEGQRVGTKKVKSDDVSGTWLWIQGMYEIPHLRCLKESLKCLIQVSSRSDVLHTSNPTLKQKCRLTSWRLWVSRTEHILIQTQWQHKQNNFGKILIDFWNCRIRGRFLHLTNDVCHQGKVKSDGARLNIFVRFFSRR